MCALWGVLLIAPTLIADCVWTIDEKRIKEGHLLRENKQKLLKDKKKEKPEKSKGEQLKKNGDEKV